MTMQLDLFGTATPSPARRPARADTALLLAMSADHITAAAAPPPARPAPSPRQGFGDAKTAAKLRAMADAMQPAIDNKNAPRRGNTPKQRRQAAEARQDAAELERAQAIMRALADRHDARDVPPALHGIATKAAIMELAKEEIDRRNAGYYDAGWPTGKPYDWRDGTKATQARAAWALIDLAKEAERREAEALRQKIEAARFAKIPGYFPTPAALVTRMIDAANLAPGSRVLEPSAGSGAIADAVREAGHQVDCVERHGSLRAILETKGHKITGRDFMEDYMRPDVLFDAVLMNPPFEQGQDCIHVRAAWQMVRPGGVLVAIMGAGILHRQQRPYTDTREWLEQEGADMIELPAGTFAESGTGVASVMITLHKDEPEEAPPPFTKEATPDSDTGRAIISRANAARDAMLLTPEWREMVKSWGKPEHNFPPSNAMRLHLAAIEQAIAEGEAAEEPQDEDDCEAYTCTECSLEFRGGGYPRDDGQGKRCHWCHREHNATPLPAETFKQAREAYSADVIAMKGTTRAPFRFEGADWITTSTFGRKGEGACESYRLAPDDGSAVSYNDWDWDTMRGSAMGGYHGMAAKVRGQAMRLVGPPRTFSEASPAAPKML